MKKYYLISIGVIVVAAVALAAHPSSYETGVIPPPAPAPAIGIAPAVPAAQDVPIPPVADKAAAPHDPRAAIGQNLIKLDIARTKAEVEQGLSGRLSLPADRGMLFEFAKPDVYSFWMPDMHFDIDIIWVNNGKVVDITRNASKVFDPQHPVFYRPKSAAQYVLEVNAGYAKLHGITVGEKVSFSDVPDL